jgi:osmoprotectant transport system ATP-binding protein
MSALEKVVEFDEVSYEVSGTLVLDRLSFAVKGGEVLVLLGESGCGKTTTLQLINRLIAPTSGRVLVDGRSTADWDVIELRRRIGYVLQDGGLFPHMTVEENVGIVMRLSDGKPHAIGKRAAEMLDLVGLDPGKFASRYPHELSGGQRQRVGVARALAADPELLLLDEPFGALDAITRTNIQKEFAGLVRKLGKTAVFVTHDLHEAMLLASRIALMDKGRIAVLDTPDGFRRSDLPLVQAYLETVALIASGA